MVGVSENRRYVYFKLETVSLNKPQVNILHTRPNLNRATYIVSCDSLFFHKSKVVTG
jgi:hypothetical protein